MRRPALALLLGCLLLVAGASALDGYYYYQTIEYAGCDQEVYQQDIVIHRTTGTAYNETAGGLETWHIYVGEHCREDYGDIRFTNSTGELAYYLWPDYDSSSARFAVRLEGADQSGALQVWYGNPSATTTSDGDATYPLFDDFVGSSVDTTKWIVHIGALGSPSVSVSNSEITFKSGATGTGARYAAVESRQKFGPGYRMIGRLRAAEIGVRPGRYTIIGFGATYHIIEASLLGDVVAAQGGLYWRDAGSGNANWGTVVSTERGGDGSHTARESEFVSDTYQTFTVVMRPDGADWIIDGATYSTTPNPITWALPVVVGIDAHLKTAGDPTTDIVDWILVRAYSAAPPAATAFSGEQQTAAPPITAFTATPTAGLAPLTVQFTDTSTGHPTSWSWSFGDGNTSSTQNPQHTYTVPGTYSVTLTATNEYGSDYELKTDYITVYGPITAQFSATPTGGTAPLTVTFTDTSAGTPTAWSWSFGDGTTSSSQNPQHTYTTAGAHTVTLTASHPYDSDTETKTSYIIVAVLQPFPGLTNIPRDLDNNGHYTDINGNGRLDYNDLTVFFQHLAWAKTAQPIACFDFNGNGWLDYNDVITLFSTIMEEHT